MNRKTSLHALHNSLCQHFINSGILPILFLILALMLPTVSIAQDSDSDIANASYTPAPPDARHVSEWGAVGDGVTDDSNALRSAAEWAKDNAGNLAFGPGATYAITRGMLFADGGGFHIYGQNAMIRVKDGYEPGSWEHPISIRYSTNFLIQDITIDGNRDNRTPADEWVKHNILLRDTEGFTLQNVRSINAPADGFYVATEDTNNLALVPRDGLFLNVEADNVFRNGLKIYAGQNLRIIGSTFRNAFGSWGQTGINVEPISGGTQGLVAGLTFRGNRFIGNYGTGLKLVGYHNTVEDVVVEGNYFHDNHKAAMLLASPCLLCTTGTSLDDVVIRGNHFFGQYRTTSGAPAWSGDQQANILKNQHMTYGVVELTGKETHVIIKDNLFANVHFDHGGHTPIHPAPLNPPVINDQTYVGSNSTISITGNEIYDFDNEAILPASHAAGNTIDADHVIDDPGMPTGADFDHDGIEDSADNCIETANPDQRDSNGDGYGNLCDADLDNNGTVSFSDLDLFRARFGTADPDADFDGSGSVSFADLDIFRQLFGQPPGPAGEF